MAMMQVTWGVGDEQHSSLLLLLSLQQFTLEVLLSLLVAVACGS